MTDVEDLIDTRREVRRLTLELTREQTKTLILEQDLKWSQTMVQFWKDEALKS